MEHSVTTIAPVFAIESFSPEFIAELEPLLRAHYLEIAHYKDIPLSPDWTFYHKAESIGMLKIFTARAEGKLIGYSLWFVKPSPHYSTSLQAVSDIIFIDPVYRGAFVGSKFVAWCDERLKADGVQVVYYHLKAAHNWGKMLERHGYELQDLIFSKRLDR